jgi:hypothetical protein
VISRILIIPVILVGGVFGYFAHIDTWVLVVVGGSIGVGALVADSVLERRKKSRRKSEGDGGIRDWG